MRIYLDSCVVIYLIEDPDVRHAAVTDAMRQRPEASFCVSELVRMECRIGPLRCSDEHVLAEYDDFFASVMTLPMTRPVFDLAAELRARHAVKTPDALHVATGVVHHCTEFWTNDLRLRGVSSDVRFRVVT